jgi:hypothetical protein
MPMMLHQVRRDSGEIWLPKSLKALKIKDFGFGVVSLCPTYAQQDLQLLLGWHLPETAIEPPLKLLPC